MKYALSIILSGAMFFTGFDDFSKRHYGMATFCFIIGILLLAGVVIGGINDMNKKY
jgi:hypothetical protein